MRRAIIISVVALISLVATTGALSATKLTNKNSVTHKLYTATTQRFQGTNCGTTATIVDTLPTGSTGVKVVTPKVGDRDSPIFAESGTQISAISIVKNQITLTAVADGPKICDPTQTGYLPGEPVPWQASYKLEADYSRRIPTVIRTYYDSYVNGAKWKTKPKTIQDSRKGTPRGVRARYVNLKWSSFGGKKAIATGKAKLGYCRAGDSCPDNNAPALLVATKPRFCKNSGQFEYRNLNIYIRGRLSAGIPIVCDP
jgi:hypothetical protein